MKLFVTELSIKGGWCLKTERFKILCCSVLGQLMDDDIVNFSK